MDKETSSKETTDSTTGINQSFELSCEVEHAVADASTQTEDLYSDDDEDDDDFMIDLHPRLHTNIISDSKPYENHTQFKLEPADTVKHILSCSQQKNPQPPQTGISDDSTKRFECEICHKTLSSLSSFVQHKTVHTGEKPYQCEYCDRTFRQLGNLAGHRRTHIGSKPYKCKVCDKRFANSSNVVVHMRTHTGEKPFKCDICHKMFKQFAHLVGHKRTHTGELPFQCDICQKRFNNPSNLTTHKRIHGGERPYQCDICNKTFKQSGHLSSHMRSHIPEQPLSTVKVAEVVSPLIAEQCSDKVLIKPEKN